MLYPNLPSIYIACSRKTKFEMITSWRSWSTKWPSSSSCLAKAFLKLPPNLSRTRVWGVQLPQGLIWRCYCVAKSSWNIWCERSRSSSPSLRWWVLHSTTATYPYSCYTSTHLHAQLSGCLNMLKHVCQASGPQIRGVCVSSASLRRNSFEPKPFPKKAQCSPASVGKASHVQTQAFAKELLPKDSVHHAHHWATWAAASRCFKASLKGWGNFAAPHSKTSSKTSSHMPATSLLAVCFWNCRVFFCWHKSLSDACKQQQPPSSDTRRLCNRKSHQTLRPPPQ